MIYMIILKIGGSILTNKDAAESEIDEKNLSRIAKEIKSSLDNDSKEIIIVHGAGSARIFGCRVRLQAGKHRLITDESFGAQHAMRQ